MPELDQNLGADVATGSEQPRWTGRPASLTTTDDLVNRIAGDPNLHAAWERVRDNARARGTWSPALRKFESALGHRLADIATALREGSWQPSALVHVPLRKELGGVRHLHVPPVADRVVERAVVQVLADLIDPHLSPSSYAFRPGRGVADAVRDLAARRDDGATHVARFDIVDCFSSLGHELLVSELRRYLDDRWLLDLIGKLIERDLPGLPRQQRLTGIAQGSPLSPLLANLVLERLDTAMHDAGFPVVRFADDVAIAANSEARASTALQVARERAEDLGLLIQHPRAVTSFADVVEFLGEQLGPDFPPADESALAPAPSKRSLYLSARTGHVQLRKGQVRALTRDGEELLAVPVRSVGRIVVTGPISVAAGLRSYVLHNDIEVLFLSRNGSLLGRYDGGCEVEPQLRRRQYALLDDEPSRTMVGRRMAAGKIANQRALLLRYGRRDDGTTDADAPRQLAQLHLQALEADAPAQVMGCEGAASRIYHRSLGGVLPADVEFTRRVRRPPKDPVNAALSYGYTLLTGEAHAACAAAGLDPQVGLLHSSERRRPALALDLVEEFRPLIVDSLVVAGFRRGRFTPEQFRTGPNGAVLLNDRGRRTFIDAYETRMLSRYRSALSPVRQSYRDGLREQARHLADVVLNRVECYQPVGWR